LQVHVNGVVSLSRQYVSWWPYLYPYYYYYYYGGQAIIAPFWTDIDLRNTDGVVYLGHISRSSAEQVVTTKAAEVFDKVKSLVLDGAGDAGFLPTEVVTVTWHNVSPYPGYYYNSQVRTIYAISK